MLIEIDADREVRTFKGRVQLIVNFHEAESRCHMILLVDQRQVQARTMCAPSAHEAIRRHALAMIDEALRCSQD